MAVASTSKAIKTGGDDLDDGLELDPELLAPSDGSDVEGEEVDVDEMRVDGVDEEDEVDDGDLQEDEEEPRKRAGVKRKVENLDEDAKAEEKKRRKKEKEKERKARVCSQRAYWSGYDSS
jgi:protein CMS1